MKSGNRYKRCQFLQMYYLTDERTTVKQGSFSFEEEPLFFGRKDGAHAHFQWNTSRNRYE
jgi:hypothetical protein